MSTPTQETLYKLLEEHKAQPVGSGYIDIIVARENYKAFAKALIERGFHVHAISWWEYIEDEDKPNSYGYGGPRSRFYPGWFAEACAGIDEIPESNDLLGAIIEMVEGKHLGEHDGKLVSFRTTQSLTPAFWLSVDGSWNNHPFKSHRKPEG